MGFLKKITRPISKVLDKIVPNEIKPALPFLAAAAPFLAPGIMGTSMLQRALVSGGLNLGSQLAQEGSEGDFSALSLAMASGIGALSAPNAASTIRGVDPNFVGPQPAPEGILGQGKEFLAKGADKLTGLSEGLAADGIFSKAGAKALSIPFTQGTMDLAVADTRRFNKQQIIDDALGALDDAADDAARASAIRLAMQQYGFTEDEITETISSAGYRAGGRVGFDNGGDVEKELDTVLVMIEGPDGVEVKEVLKSEALRENLKIVSDTGEFNQYRFDNVENKKAGGRVGFRFGGIDEAIETVQEETIEKGKDGIMTAAKEDPLLVEEYNKYVFDLMEQRPDAKPMSFQDFKRMIMSGMKDGGIMATEIPLKDSVKNINKKGQPDTTMVKMKEGGLMNLGGKEMDLRGGGFVPIGKKERADDVPARLSKNEFVMTADAVRAAGGGSVNEGAKRMYKVMNDLEARA